MFLKTMGLAVAALFVAPVVKLKNVFAEMVKLDDPLVKAL